MLLEMLSKPLKKARHFYDMMQEWSNIAKTKQVKLFSFCDDIT